MSKAEDRAIEKYPIEMYEEVGWRCVDKNTHKRQYFIEGYHQAEKDNALTWEDIKKIGDLFQDVARDSRANKDLNASFKKDLDAPFKEILRRFLEQKGG